MISEHRDEVIANIKNCSESGQWNSKVEIDDPDLSAEEKTALVKDWLKNRYTLKYKVNNKIARIMSRIITDKENKNTVFTGLKNIKDVQGGAIITSNHFNPMDNTAIQKMVRKSGKKRLFIVSQETNLAMKGLLGFFMNYMDIIPITSDSNYMERDFYGILKEKTGQGQYILIYPEQEMWFNYRKPRPLKRGAYYYAARLGVPVISCFVEIRDQQAKETEEFYKVRYIVHVLKPIYPDPKKSVRENSFEMMEKDYAQKVRAYEKSYKKRLDPKFENADIAGWIRKEA